MSTPSEVIDVELIEANDCGWWSCNVYLEDGTVLDCCEVFAGWGPDGGIDRSTLRDMSGPTPRYL